MKHYNIGSGAHSFYMLRENRKPPLREDFTNASSKKKTKFFCSSSNYSYLCPQIGRNGDERTNDYNKIRIINN